MSATPTLVIDPPRKAASRGTPRQPMQPTVAAVSRTELRQYEEAWRALAASAVVANSFYEPWTVLAALEHLLEEEDVRFVLVFGPPERNGNTPLWGFFPVEIQRRCLQVPVRTLAFWKHRHCFLSTPLVREGREWETLRAFWLWFEQNPFGCRILDTNYLIADGPFHHVWADFAIGRTALVLNDFPRAFLEVSGPAASYIAGAVSKKHLDEYLRLERRLSETGDLRVRRIESASEVHRWIDDFLRLEANGWKGGADGDALAKCRGDAEYLRTLVEAGFAEDRVTLLSMELDGTPVAMKINLHSKDGAFAFKIAYDEAFARYSPGVLLELENIRHTFADARVRWMDSCAVPRHVMANRLWRERRMIRRTIFSDSTRWGDLIVSVLPLLRWLSARLRPRKPLPYLQISTKKYD